MKIQEINNAIALALKLTGYVNDVLVGYLNIPQASFTAPQVLLTYTGEFAPGNTIVLTATSDLLSDMTILIDGEIVVLLHNVLTLTYSYTVSEGIDFTNISASATNSVGLSDDVYLNLEPVEVYAVQSFSSSLPNYNPAFQQYLYTTEGIAENEFYTTQEEAAAVTAFTNAFTAEQVPELTHLDELRNFTSLTTIPELWSSGSNGYATNCNSIVLPDSLTTIGALAFMGMPLTSLHIPANVSAESYSAFLEIGYISDIESSTANMLPTLTSDSVTSDSPNYVIYGNALYANVGGLLAVCSVFEGGTINVPDNLALDLMAIAGYTMYGSIMNYEASASNPSYSTDEYGVLYNKTKTGLILFPTAPIWDTFTVPDSCLTIGIGGYTSIPCNYRLLIIPNSVTFGRTTFTGETINSNIRSYRASSSQTVVIYLTDNCESIILGTDTTNISAGAFHNCNTVAEIYCSATTPPTITPISFRDIQSNIPVYVPAESLLAYQNSTWGLVFSNIQSGTAYAVQSFDSSLPNYNPELQAALYDGGIVSTQDRTTMAEAAAVTELSAGLFMDATIRTCNELQYFTNLATIKNNCFDNSYLEEIIIPASVTSIETYAFHGCGYNDYLTATILATTPPTLGANAFDSTATIKVPAESVSTYQSASGWSSYNIVPIS